MFPALLPLHDGQQGWARVPGARVPDTHRVLGSSGNCKLPKVSGRSRMMEEDAEVTISCRQPGQGGEEAAAELPPTLSSSCSSRHALLRTTLPQNPHAPLASY